MRRKRLGGFEYQLLSVLMQEPRGSYGAAILDRVEELAHRSVSVGAIYTTLDRLKVKGLVSSWWGEPTPERGGRRKRFYRIEANGIRAVQQLEAEMRGFIRSGSLAREGP